jgi:hypothetical protein
MDGEGRLEEIVCSTDWLLRALIAARELDAPEWMIGAGAVRTAVWDRLHGYESRSGLDDIDLAFFDPADVSEEREDQMRTLLETMLPDECWDAKNQAAVHLWYPKRFGYAVEALRSTAEAVATWPEFATCVALRLTRDDRLMIEAPYGLEDLLGMVNRRNPARVSIIEYERRLASKRTVERWPKATIIPAR